MFISTDFTTKTRYELSFNGPFPPASALRARAFQFAIRIDSIRYANRFESIRFVKKIGLSIH